MSTRGRRLVRIQGKGQVTIPADIRRKLGLEKGDLVAVEETQEGILITPQETPTEDAVTKKALEHLDKALKKRGWSLEDLIESGREFGGQE